MLESHEVAVAHEVSSRKEPLDDTGARELLKSVSTVWIARGRNVEKRAANEVSLDDLRGRTGAFRAPIVRRGKTLLVGLHRETLEKLVSK